MSKPEEQRDMPASDSQEARELSEQEKKNAIIAIHDAILVRLDEHREIECNVLALVVAELLYDFEAFKKEVETAFSNMITKSIEEIDVNAMGKEIKEELNKQ